MNQKAKRTLVAFAGCIACASTPAYEINNHADMSEKSAERSHLLVDIGDGSYGKLFRLGLKQIPISDRKQTFPLDNSLGRIPLCYAIVTDENGKVIDDPDPNNQPGWVARNGQTWLTVAEMIRYGACYEDSTEPKLRPLAHFYNPQNDGEGLSYFALAAGPSSMVWMLNRNQVNTVLTGTNHYTWEDARESLYSALTTQLPTASVDYNNYIRRRDWGKTFQALGHISHHMLMQSSHSA